MTDRVLSHPLTACFIVSVLLLLPDRLHAQTRTDERLTIGYENEGKIDASKKACIAFVNELGGDSVETSRAARMAAPVCEFRDRHIAAYEEFQRSYRKLWSLVRADQRIDPPAAIEQLRRAIKSCIDFKDGLNFDGLHGLGVDMVPNQNATQCLAIGTRLANDEIKRLTPKGR